MNGIKLHEEFVRELQERVPKKNDLIQKISDILHLEKEPVSRRLTGRVNFSVHEIGIIAKALDISLDSLIHQGLHANWFPLKLESPLSVNSINVLCDFIDLNIEEMSEVAQDPFDYGVIFNSYPIEYYVHHPSLFKFMIFKWGYYFVGSDEFNDFSKWELPKRLDNIRESFDNILQQATHVLYIWDEALIWTLVNEINFFYRMGILKAEDLQSIKFDLQQSLIHLEKYIAGTFIPENAAQNMSFYVSNMNMGVSSHYLCSEKRQLYSFKTNFTFLSSHNNYSNFYDVRRWINSMKNISVLISGSGPLERKAFFMKQYDTLDYFLKTE